jgi:hypothetical protein
MDERIESWAAEFGKEHAQVCAAFLHAATDHPGLPADRIDAAAVRHAMVDHMPELTLAPDVRARVPEIVAGFLESLEAAGRVAPGLAEAARSASGEYRARLPVRREAPKVSRNDPCPCGSGKKFKKCCGA